MAFAFEAETGDEALGGASDLPDRPLCAVCIGEKWSQSKANEDKDVSMIHMPAHKLLVYVLGTELCAR